MASSASAALPAHLSTQIDNTHALQEYAGLQHTLCSYMQYQVPLTPAITDVSGLHPTAPDSLVDVTVPISMEVLFENSRGHKANQLVKVFAVRPDTTMSRGVRPKVDSLHNRKQMVETWTNARLTTNTTPEDNSVSLQPNKQWVWSNLRVRSFSVVYVVFICDSVQVIKEDGQRLRLVYPGCLAISYTATDNPLSTPTSLADFTNLCQYKWNLSLREPLVCSVNGNDVPGPVQATEFSLRYKLVESCEVPLVHTRGAALLQVLGVLMQCEGMSQLL